MISLKELLLSHTGLLLIVSALYVFFRLVDSLINYFTRQVNVRSAGKFGQFNSFWRTK